MTTRDWSCMEWILCNLLSYFNLPWRETGQTWNIFYSTYLTLTQFTRCFQHTLVRDWSSMDLISWISSPARTELLIYWLRLRISCPSWSFSVATWWSETEQLCVKLSNFQMYYILTEMWLKRSDIKAKFLFIETSGYCLGTFNEAIFLYCCPKCSSCWSDSHSIDWPTWGIWEAIIPALYV